MTTVGKFILFAFLVGCSQPNKETPRVVYITTPLELPAKPELPKMSSNALMCVSDETKWTLLKRDMLIKDYVSQLETIIKSTKK